MVAREIEAEKLKVADSFEKEVNDRNEGVPYMLNLKEKGMNREEIVEEIQKHLDLGNISVSKISFASLKIIK